MHAGIRFSTFGPTSAPTVTAVGSCNFNADAGDGMAYVQSYDGLYADVLNCVGNNGGAVESNAFFPNPTCTNNFPQSVHSAPLEHATFADGEWMVLCTVPDDNGAGSSQANSEGAPYTVYQQGFACQAAIGVGPTDSSPYVAKGNDSLEYSQTYVENGQTVTALTTSCIGRVPNTVTIDTSAPVSHLVSCTQYDPQAPGKVVRGLGETITYRDGQYQETCNVPAYKTSAVCTTGTNCSTTSTADATSSLVVTETPTTPGLLSETLDYGTQLSCAGRLYGAYTGFDPNWYGFSFTGSGSKQLTYDLFNVPFSTDAPIEICFGATVSFVANSDDGHGAAGTLPDGTAGFIGLLPGCSPGIPDNPCISSIGPINPSAPSGGTQVIVNIPSGFTGDPFIHG